MSQSKTIRVGDTVELKGQRIGLVRFKGSTQFAKGEWYGIELYNSYSRHDGIIMQKRYFRSPRNRGLFVRRQIIVKVVPQDKANKQLRVFQRAGFGSSTKAKGNNMTTYMNRISGFASTMPKNFNEQATESLAQRISRSQDPPTTLNDNDSGIGSHIKATRSANILATATVADTDDNNNNDNNDDNENNDNTMAVASLKDRVGAKSQPPNSKKREKSPRGNKTSKSVSPGGDRESDNNKTKTKTKGGSVNVGATVPMPEIPSLNSMSKSNPHTKMKSPKSKDGRIGTPKSSKSGKKTPKSGKHENNNSTEDDGLGEISNNPLKKDSNAGRRMIRKRRERMMSIEVSSIEADAMIIPKVTITPNINIISDDTPLSVKSNHGKDSIDSTDDISTTTTTSTMTTPSTATPGSSTPSTAGAGAGAGTGASMSTTAKTGTPRSTSAGATTTRVDLNKDDKGGIKTSTPRKHKKDKKSDKHDNSKLTPNRNVTSPRKSNNNNNNNNNNNSNKPKVTLQSPIHTSAINEPGLLSPQTPKEMANTHPSMSNLESFSHHTHRVSYGMDPVFTRLDRRRQRTSDVLLLQNSKLTVSPSVGGDNNDDDDEEDDEEYVDDDEIYSLDNISESVDVAFESENEKNEDKKEEDGNDKTSKDGKGGGGKDKGKGKGGNKVTTPDKDSGKKKKGENENKGKDGSGSSKEQNGENKKEKDTPIVPKLSPQASSNSKKKKAKEKLKLKRKFSGNQRREEAKAKREFLAKKQMGKNKKKGGNNNNNKKDNSKDKKGGKGIKALVKKVLGAIDDNDDEPKFEIGPSTDNEEEDSITDSMGSPSKSGKNNNNRVQFSNNDSVIVNDDVITTPNNVIATMANNISNGSDSRNNDVFPKVDLNNDNEQHVMRKLSSIFLENPSDLKSKLRKVTKKEKSEENTIRSIYSKYPARADFPNLGDYSNETLIAELLTSKLYARYRKDYTGFECIFDDAIKCGCFYLPDPIGIRLGDPQSYDLFYELIDEILAVLHNDFDASQYKHPRDLDWRKLVPSQSGKHAKSKSYKSIGGGLISQTTAMGRYNNAVNSKSPNSPVDKSNNSQAYSSVTSQTPTASNSASTKQKKPSKQTSMTPKLNKSGKFSNNKNGRSSSIEKNENDLSAAAGKRVHIMSKSSDKYHSSNEREHDSDDDRYNNGSGDKKLHSNSLDAQGNSKSNKEWKRKARSHDYDDPNDDEWDDNENDNDNDNDDDYSDGDESSHDSESETVSESNDAVTTNANAGASGKADPHKKPPKLDKKGSKKKGRSGSKEKDKEKDGKDGKDGKEKKDKDSKKRKHKKKRRKNKTEKKRHHHVRTGMTSSSLLNEINLLPRKYVTNCRITLSRNIHGFRFQPTMQRAERRKVEKLIANVLSNKKASAPLKGKYKKYNDINPSKIPLLIEKDKLFPKPDSPGLILAGYARDWPESRGLFVNSSKNLYIWVNYLEHIHLLSVQNDNNILLTFKLLVEAHDQLEQAIRKQQEDILNTLKSEQEKLKKRKMEVRARSRTSSRAGSRASSPTRDDSKSNNDATFGNAVDNSNNNNNNNDFTPMEKELLELNFDDCHSGFVYDESVGYITSSPQFFGTAMRVYVTVRIPLLLQHESFEDILDSENLSAYQHDINATQLFMEYAQASNAAQQQSQLNSFVNTYEMNKSSHQQASTLPTLNADALLLDNSMTTPITGGANASPSPHSFGAATGTKQSGIGSIGNIGNIDTDTRSRKYSTKRKGSQARGSSARATYDISGFEDNDGDDGGTPDTTRVHGSEDLEASQFSFEQAAKRKNTLETAQTMKVKELTRAQSHDPHGNPKQRNRAQSSKNKKDRKNKGNSNKPRLRSQSSNSSNDDSDDDDNNDDGSSNGANNTHAKGVSLPAAQFRAFSPTNPTYVRKQDGTPVGGSPNASPHASPLARDNVKVVLGNDDNNSNNNNNNSNDKSGSNKKSKNKDGGGSKLKKQMSKSKGIAFDESKNVESTGMKSTKHSEYYKKLVDVDGSGRERSNNMANRTLLNSKSRAKSFENVFSPLVSGKRASVSHIPKTITEMGDNGNENEEDDDDDGLDQMDIIQERESVTLFQSVSLGLTEIDQVKQMIKSVNKLIELEQLLEDGASLPTFQSAN